MELVEALESFNRKERNLLIRAALGHQNERLLLSDSFCTKVDDWLKIGLSPEAWWATDYHFSWLAGALCLYINEIDQALKPLAKVGMPRGRSPLDPSRLEAYESSPSGDPLRSGRTSERQRPSMACDQNGLETL